MKQFFTFISLLLSGLLLAQNGAPAPYYNNVDLTKTGNALKNELANKISGTHTRTLNYNQAWEALKIVDLDTDDNTNTNVLLLYGFSSTICPSSQSDDNNHRRRNKNSNGGSATCEWNREHTYAKSLGNPNLGTSGPGADAHHLRASDVQRNGNRGSKKFIAGSGNSGNVGSGWYPGDEWKGDVARMMMYMYLRYGNRCLPKNVAIGSPVATDTNMIQLLLQWNAEDPVSEYEDRRNNYLGSTSNPYGQGNRNPFIDNPYLATLIWGGPSAEDRWNMLSVTAPSEFENQVSVYPNPAINNEVTIYAKTTIDEIQLINLNGQIIQQIKKPDFDNESFKLKNLSRGFYLLRLRSDNQNTTKKIIVN